MFAPTREPLSIGYVSQELMAMQTMDVAGQLQTARKIMQQRSGMDTAPRLSTRLILSRINEKTAIGSRFAAALNKGIESVDVVIDPNAVPSKGAIALQKIRARM